MAVNSQQLQQVLDYLEAHPHADYELSTLLSSLGLMGPTIDSLAAAIGVHPNVDFLGNGRVRWRPNAGALRHS